MADESQKPPDTPPTAAADKQPSAAPAEPLKGEVSRTDAPGAGASAAPVAAPRTEPPAPKPANPEAAVTATTSETSSATGKPTPSADSPAATPAAAPTTPAAPAAPPKPPVAKPAAAAGGAAPAPKPAAGAAAAKPAGTAAAPGAKPAAAAAKPAAAHEPPKAAPPSGPPDPPPPANTPLPPFIESLQSAIPGAVAHVSYYLGDWTIIVPVAHVLEVARHLHAAPDALFDYCSDVTATDWPPRAERFDVVYMLYSIRLRHRVRMKVKVTDGQPIASVVSVWPAANWLEREVYDLFGINFTGHPDRRRILMPEDWQGHPQRKDYPLEGPGELLMENPLDWLKLRQAREEADIE